MCKPSSSPTKNRPPTKNSPGSGEAAHCALEDAWSRCVQERRRAEEKHAWAKNMILLGDFDVYDTTDATMRAITDAGLVVPERLQKLPSNTPKTKYYDQIAFVAPQLENHLELLAAGVFDSYAHVYREEDEAMYLEEMGEAYLRDKKGEERDEKAKTRYYRTWRTYQMSDHLPMWIELKTDFGEEYLKRKAGA